QVHDSRVVWPALVHREVQPRFLCRSWTVDMPSVDVQPAESARLETSQRHVRRRHHVATCVEADAEIPRRTAAVPPREQRAPMAGQRLACLFLVHAAIPSALAKNSTLPKFPDFNARW